MAPTFPSDIHLRLTEEHARIRVSLAQIEALAAAPPDGPGEEAALSLASALSRLALLLASHNANEEAALRPLLAQTEAWGPDRIEEMIADHVAEHAALRAMIAPLKDLTDLPRLRRSSLDLVAHLRDHLESEERAFLNRRVLCDDDLASEEAS
jgi:iron-sulfur cluster repair protein YtfE (RIC family)